jgi:hypothetical protein
MTWQQGDLAALAPVPWRNGGGTTRVLAASASEPFIWRASVATVATGGPFSSFDGYRRVLVLLDGDGMVLRFRDRHARLGALGAQAAFSGAEPCDAELVGGPTLDFNWVVSDRFDVGVRALRSGDGGRGSLAFAMGAAEVEADGAFASLAAGGFLVAPGGALPSGQLRVLSGGPVLLAWAAEKAEDRQV